MESERFTQTLNKYQFEKALTILRREQQANTPSPLQKKLFHLLSVTIYGFTVAFVSTFFLIFVLFLYDK